MLNQGGTKLRKMSTENCNEKCLNSDLIVNVKAKRPVRFKAGAELSGKVNIMDVEVNEEIGENFQEIEIKLRLTSETCVSNDSFLEN